MACISAPVGEGNEGTLMLHQGDFDVTKTDGFVADLGLRYSG